MKGLVKDNEVRSRICSKSGEEKDSKAQFLLNFKFTGRHLS